MSEGRAPHISYVGGLWATHNGAPLADSAPIRRQRRSVAVINELRESASEGSLYPSVAVKPKLAADHHIGQHAGFHSALTLREPIGMITPYIEHELTSSIKNMGRQHGMDARRISQSEAPPPADDGAPQPMPTVLLPSTVMRNLWPPTKTPLSNEIFKAAAEVTTVSPSPSAFKDPAEGRRTVMEGRTRVCMCHDEFLSDNPLLSGMSAQHGESCRLGSGRAGSLRLEETSLLTALWAPEQRLGHLGAAAQPWVLGEKPPRMLVLLFTVFDHPGA